MNEVIIDESERRQYTEFKRKINLQAAQAQVKKIEYNLTDAAVEKSTLRRACQDATSLKLGAVCVLPSLVKSCVSFLGTQPQSSVIACISYPHGGDSLKTKVAAVKNAFKDGADEAEVTVPLAFIKDGNWSYLRREFKKVKKAAKKHTVRINVESAFLTPQEVTKVCSVAVDCGITSLRSSNDMRCGGGFDAETVSRMHSVVKDKCTLKADGITNVTDMNAAVDMGASVIGSKNATDLARLILQTADE